MAEKGVLINDQTGGESVACRDAILQDDDANNRIIQLTDKAARPIVYQLSTPLRTLTDGDSNNITTLPTGIANNLIDVSDAETCVFWAKVEMGGDTDSTTRFRVTPIIVSEDATPTAVALLPPFEIMPVYPNKTGSAFSDRIGFDSAATLTLVHAFPTLGAKEIGFHVKFAVGTSTNFTLKIYAAPSSGGGRNSGVDVESMDETWGAGFGAVT